MTNTNGSSTGAIPTAVPFLTISPDSRSAGTGDAGVAISPDVNANFWNPSKLVFIKEDDAVGLSYSPWMRHLVPDMSLSNLSFAHKISDRDALGASLRYFNLGTMQLTDINQNNEGLFRPYEYALDMSYARKFGESFSLGLTGRYIYSAISNQSFASGTAQTLGAAKAIATDVSLYYFVMGDDSKSASEAPFAVGLNISNIGTKVRYSSTGPSYFLPANMKLGMAGNWNWDEDNRLTVTIDLNKLLVPTPPVRDANGNIISGTNDDISVPSGLFSSFTDAPGGFRQEIQEINVATGLEYVYSDQFYLRAGYFYENPNQGNRQYLTIGMGLKYDVFRFDFSYLAARQQTSPLANTIRVGLSMAFGASK
ncbi:MAG: type IX secretion system outer membrane channel protein PorV [Mucilaginibacter sp.]